MSFAESGKGGNGMCYLKKALNMAIWSGSVHGAFLNSGLIGAPKAVAPKRPVNTLLPSVIGRATSGASTIRV